MPPHSKHIRSRAMAVGFSLFCCLVLYGICASVHSASIKTDYVTKADGIKELLLVHLVFRHGPRTPADTYPLDPHVNETFYPFGWGQLTSDGKQFMYDHGKWLRKRYDHFLGSLYHPDIVHAQATGVTRTHMSLALTLAGLWPPKDTPSEWNKNLNWQPIPIFSQPLDEDNFLLVRTSCPRYYEALDEVFEQDDVKLLMKTQKPLFDNLTKITGLNITTLDDVQSLYSTLRAETEYGLKLPPWTEYFYPEPMKTIAELSYVLNVHTDELKRIKGGPFVKKMIGEWQNKINDSLKPEKRKLFIYTGHDSTVVNILSALNIWEEQFPTYGVMGMFELYRDSITGNHFVQAYLKNSTLEEPYPLTIPGCDFSCPVEHLIQLAKPVIPDDLEEHCKPHDNGYVEPTPGGP